MRPAAGRRLGRYRLIAPLGRGAQATVWRALDEKLQRQVALKLAEPGAAQPPGGWLQEARAVGRLAHPHIVPVFDAEQLDGIDCIAFELVEGRTLAALLRERGRLPPREAVELMLGVVDALRAAHGQGIVHRDLKPSNILVDAGGRARVMDFGIAARLPGGGGPEGGATDVADAVDVAAPADPLAGCIVGTPGYLSPEAAVAAAAAPPMDVFAAGLVLGELLSGERLVPERAPDAALRRVRDDDLVLPDHADADDRLRAIVQRAVARQPADRYGDAASLRDALMQWLAPPEQAQAPSGNATLDFLLRRMRLKSDFPALTGHVVRIQRLAASDVESLTTLADEILKDVALTQKLLRLVNTVHYRRHGAGVATVSRAVALVGLAGIRNLALSLVLVEHMKDKAHAQRLKEEFLRSMLAAQVAHALAAGTRDAEESYLGALFHNLGQLLTEYYFPDEAEAIRAQRQLPLSAADARLHPDVLADRAAQVVLGVGFEALGTGVARHWSLPDSLQRCLRRPDGPPPPQPLPAGPERMRWLALAANEVADAAWQADAGQWPQHLDALQQRHGRALGLRAGELRRALDMARGVLAEVAPVMGLSLPRASRGGQLLAAPAVATAAANPQPDLAPAATLAANAPTVAAGRAGRAAGPTPAEAATDLLAAGIQDITETLAGDGAGVNVVLRMVLETMFRALAFQRVVFCLRNPAGDRLLGRFGLGDRAAALSAQFEVVLRAATPPGPDLFGAACLQGGDMLVADARTPTVARRLPAWYREQVDAPSFLLLPLRMKQAPFALIYADGQQAGGLRLSERELSLLRTLRNQALVAFRQATPTG